MKISMIISPMWSCLTKWWEHYAGKIFPKLTEAERKKFIIISKSNLIHAYAYCCMMGIALPILMNKLLVFGVWQRAQENERNAKAWCFVQIPANIPREFFEREAEKFHFS